MKKTLSLVLTLLLAFGVLTINVSAEEFAVNFQHTENQAFVQMKHAIEETGVTISDDTDIQLVSSGLSAISAMNEAGTESEPVMALKVTNTVGSSVYTDLIIPGQADSIGFKVSRSSNLASEVKNYLESSLFNIRITAVYDPVNDAPLNAYVRPNAVYFRYTKKGSANVSNVYVRYYCGGVLQTYPGYETVQSDYVHLIPLVKSLPGSSVEYSSVLPLASNRVINTGAGIAGDHSISVDVQVNSKVYSTAFKLNS